MTVERGAGLCNLQHPAGEFCRGSPTCDTQPGSLSFHRKGAEVRASGHAFSEKGRMRRGGALFPVTSNLGLVCSSAVGVASPSRKRINTALLDPPQSVRSLSQSCQLNPKDVTESVLLRPPFRPPVEIRKWPKFRELRCPVNDILISLPAGSSSGRGERDFFDLTALGPLPRKCKLFNLSCDGKLKRSSQ